MTGDKIVEATTTSATHQVSQVLTTSADTSYTVSGFFKAAERSKFNLFLSTKSGLFPYGAFDLAAGSANVSGAAVARIHPVGEGWYRCSTRVDVLSGGSNTTLTVQLKNDAGAGTYAGTPGSGLYAWGFQANPGLEALDYIASEATAVAAQPQAGAALYTGGWTPNTAGILKAGDYLGVNGELKLLTLDAASDPWGNALLTFEPPLRASPPDGAALSFSQPTAVFRLADDDQDTIPIRAPVRGSVTLTFEEVFA